MIFKKTLSKSGPQTPVFSLYFWYNWNLFYCKIIIGIQTFFFLFGSSVVLTSFGEKPSSFPVRKWRLCVLGMHVDLELFLESWPFSTHLSCTITDYSFMMFTTE